jgi:TetR/AcrR family transcriptional regulator, regulator of autoinduction and epiphytic fitness
MPARRSDAEREDKVEEILVLAARQLEAGGVEAISMAAIARQLGVAQNTIRWYFPSRAELVVATMRRRLAAIAARKPRGRELVPRILWWIDQLAPVSRYRAVLQREAADSAAVAAFVAELDATLDRMLANGFRDRLAAEELSPAVAAFRATVNGTYAEGLSPRRRRAVLEFALARLGIV